LQPNAGIPQGLDPVARLQRIKPTEPALVPAEHYLEVAFVRGVPQHSLKMEAFLGGVATDAQVSVLADDPVAVLGGVSTYLGLLVRDAGLLPVRGHAVIGDGGNEFRHGRAFLREAAPAAGLSVPTTGHGNGSSPFLAHAAKEGRGLRSLVERRFER